MSYIYNGLYTPSTHRSRVSSATFPSMNFLSLLQRDAITTRPGEHYTPRPIRPVHQAMVNITKFQIGLRKEDDSVEYKELKENLQKLRQLAYSWFFIKHELRKIVDDPSIINKEKLAASYIRDKTGLSLSPTAGVDMIRYVEDYLAIFERTDFNFGDSDMCMIQKKINILLARENLNKLTDIVTAERNKGALSSEQTLELDNTKQVIIAFRALACNWAKYSDIVDSDADDATKQTLINKELGVAVHAGNALRSNLSIALSSIGSRDESQLTIEYAKEKFNCPDPCMEARVNHFYESRSETVIRHKVNTKKDISFNIGVYYSLYTAETGQEDGVNAVAFYDWLINQDAFIGHAVSDGVITIHDVLDFIENDPFFVCDFDQASVLQCLAKYRL